MSKHIQTGSEGEEKAYQYLLGKGFKIIERNFRTRQGELDLIAYDQEVLVFIEVKTDATSKAGYATEWVNSKKIKKIQKMAFLFCWQQNLVDVSMRFDVITVDLTVNPIKIQHLESAFIPFADVYYQ